MKQGKSMVQQMKEERVARGAGGDSIVAPSRRFGWTDPVVSPAKAKNHSFASEAPKAPAKGVVGTIAPATVDLRADRARVMNARLAKRRAAK